MWQTSTVSSITERSAETRRFRVLRLLLRTGEQSAPYNHFSLSAPESQEVTICSLLDGEVATPERIKCYTAQGSLLKYVRTVRRLVNEVAYDVVHAHSPHVALLCILALMGYRRRRPPTVFTVHNSFESFRARNKLMLAVAFTWFDRVVCCGEASRNSFPWLYRRLAGERLCAVPNGVDVERVQRAEKEITRARGEDSFKAVVVSRLVPIKRPAVVLAAFAASSDRTDKLLFIGDGILRAQLAVRAKELGVAEQVDLTGAVPREVVYATLWDADLFISASRGEGLPVAPLEAMACGCPVVLSDIPPHREIANGVDFVPLVKADDVEGFAREIRRFRDMAPALRREIGQRCRQLVEDRFSLAIMHRAYDKIFSDLIVDVR